MRRATTALAFIGIASAVFLPLMYIRFSSGSAAAGWQLALLYGAAVYVIMMITRISAKRTAARSIGQIDEMTGQEFEEAFAGLLKRHGYTKIRMTPETGDSGIDVIALCGKETVGFQCKRYAKNVGNHAVMEAFAGIRAYELDRAVVVTNAYFTKAAVELAEQTGVGLWDRDTLVELLR